MKLFRVDYIEDSTPVTYLTVGEDQDTEATIEQRELKTFDNQDIQYILNYFGVKEIDEVDGYTIVVK